MMDDEISQNLYDNSPFIAWIHNISLNQQKYLKSRIEEFDFDHKMRYIIYIYDNPGCSQDDIVNMFCQSKGNIAKVLRKFEDTGYVERKTDPDNRRKYMLYTTEKGSQIVPRIRQISKDWEREVGITEEDRELKQRIMEIALNGMKLVGDAK